MTDYIPFIDNQIELPQTQFTAIIGASPSKGARSPLLWNAVYQEQGINCEMLPLDVSASQLPSLLSWLDSNANFLGGAVAVPYKEAVAQWLKTERLDSSAQGILAVNALSRSDSGQLIGANTDGLAAAKLLNELGLCRTDRVLMFGFGGAAKAVAKSILPNVASLTVATRSFDTPMSMSLARQLGITLINPLDCDETLKQVTVLINGTVLGSAPDHVNATPLPANATKLAQRVKLAFDVVYQPENTAFLQSMPAGITRNNGSQMNLLQAVYGFHLAHKTLSLELIAPIMASAANQR